MLRFGGFSGLDKKRMNRDFWAENEFLGSLTCACACARGEFRCPIKAERLYEELYRKIKRWTWRGKPTKKARKLKLLEQRTERILDTYEALYRK